MIRILHRVIIIVVVISSASSIILSLHLLEILILHNLDTIARTFMTTTTATRTALMMTTTATAGMLVRWRGGSVHDVLRRIGSMVVLLLLLMLMLLRM